MNETEPTRGTASRPSSVESTRLLTPARIVALAVIAVLVVGLAYIRFAPGAPSISVPAGAKAGDLTLEPCNYPTENGTYQADCGTLVVPETRADPRSRLIALPVTRIRARSERPAEPIFRLEGGPGITNMSFDMASRFADTRDVVLVGYRGVDGSVRLDCPEVGEALEHSTDFLGEKSFRAYGDGYRTCTKRLQRDGVDLAGYGLTQQVDDLEAGRVALGYDRIDLVSESAGTRTAMIYSWRYPTSIHRSVMIGVNPPGHFLWDASTADEQIRRYAELCARDDSCRRRTQDLAASMRRTAGDMPNRWFFLPIHEGDVRVFSFYGLMESTSTQAPMSAPTTLDSWLAAAEGDASGFWLQSVAADLFPLPFVWGQYAAAASADAHAARDYLASGGQHDESNLGYAGTAFAWGGGRLAADWPPARDQEEYSHVQTSNVETLLIGGALDFSTPPQIATNELLPSLPNGHQIVLPGLGHSASFWADQPQAGSRLISTFLDSGRVDQSLYKPQVVDFTPAVTATALAKRLAGVMVGVALLAVLVLLWLSRRVHQRGHFGRRARVTLRSLVPIVLGPGGWFLGALIVLTTMPSVPLDNQVLATFAVGAPIGLGIHLAWVNRDWSARTKTTGLASASAGALIGAWLGYNCAAWPVAALTSIVGAAIGANLILILLDISWARSGRLLARTLPVPDAERSPGTSPVS